MIKKILFLITFLVMSFLHAQETITGTVTNEEDRSGIHIINSTSKNYTTTNDLGAFEIPAKLYDTLSFISIRYKEKKVVITDSIWISKNITIKLEEAINTLDEVIVGNKLTGDLKEDINQVETVALPAFNYSWEQIKNAKFKDDRPPVRNIITTKGQFVDGVNFVAIARLLFKAIAKSKKKSTFKSLQHETFSTSYIKKYYGENFFQESLAIKEDQEDLFIQYCENIGTIIDAFKEKNDLKLLEELLKASNQFNQEANEE